MRIEQKLTFPVFFIILGNILAGIIKNKDYVYYILYVGIFIFIVITLLIAISKFKKIKLKKEVLSIVLLVFSCAALFLEDLTALNDVLFLTLSLFVSFNTKKTYIIYGAIYSILLITRYTFTGMLPYDIVLHLAGISFILIIYQHYMHPKKSIKEEIVKDYISSPVKKEVVDIVQLYILGFEYHEIGDKLELNITADRVRRKINEEVKRLGFNNREHMIFFLTEKGIISSISCDCNAKEANNDIIK